MHTDSIYFQYYEFIKVKVSTVKWRLFINGRWAKVLKKKIKELDVVAIS